MFQVGLESTVRDVARVGVAAMVVAVLGTVGSLGAGWAAATLALPGQSAGLHWFLAASLTRDERGYQRARAEGRGASRSLERARSWAPP